jgi:DHA2 family multidrug resistance protein
VRSIISPTTLFWPIVVGGLAISMVFVPLSNVALGTIPKEEVGNASGIFNFLRNIGGSVGISAANTIAQRHMQTHRNENVHWLSGSNWLFRRELTHCAKKSQVPKIVDIGPELRLTIEALLNQGICAQ